MIVIRLGNSSFNNTKESEKKSIVYNDQSQQSQVSKISTIGHRETYSVKNPKGNRGE